MASEIFTIPFMGNYIVYAPLKGTAFICNGSMASLIADLNQGTLPGELSKEAMDFIKHSDILAPEAVLPKKSFETFVPTSLMLFLTNRCNLRCIYCYASAGEYPVRDMSVETAKAAIDVVSANALGRGLDSLDLGFHGGGEPTVNWKTLTAAVEYACSKPLKVRINTSTNGYLSEPRLKYILDHFDGMSLSFDGLKEIQNRQRPHVSGRPTFSVVMRTIKAMDKKSFHYGIRMTVTPESMKLLPDSIRFLASDTGVKTVQVEPSFPQGRGAVNGVPAKSYAAFVKAFEEAYDIAEEAGIQLKYSGARIDNLTTRFCGAPSETLIVLPGGEISTCVEVHDPGHPFARDFILGTIADGEVAIDLEQWKRLVNRTVDNIDYCKDCFCKYHCAGDCIRKTFSAEKAGFFKPSARCRLNHELTRFLLLKKIASSHGLWKADATRKPVP